jgi:hypothetical protein
MSGEGGFHMRLHEGDLRDRNVDHLALTSYIGFHSLMGKAVFLDAKMIGRNISVECYPL